MNIDPYIRYTLRGRGTTCWAVEDQQGNRFLIKDYWVSDGRKPEFELLSEVKEVPGVCKMVCYKAQRAKTKDYRGRLNAYSHGDLFRNRTAVRIVLKSYGSTIDKFKSAKQLLAALRDAIAAHSTLIGKGLLHRDVSPDNILLGLGEALEGFRGVLIDLHMAIKSDRPVNEICQDLRSGTPIFYPLIALQSRKLDPAMTPAHDYLDDV
ncbi:hypothetical protein H1R20_g12020, partial [Candolleomyces eurysporus]